MARKDSKSDDKDAKKKPPAKALAASSKVSQINTTKSPISPKTLGAQYNASSIEVLSGLEPVYKRPGMYTDTSSPNHIAQEVIDNSVDEALAGFAKNITVELTSAGMMIVTDDGRGMPVDIHPTHKISGVELILTRLHSGAKFSSQSYKFSGGLHGVGVSVVNALSNRLKAEIWKEGKKYEITFADGKKTSEINESSKPTAGLSFNITHGTRISFQPNPKYFDTKDFSISHLRNILRSKAVLCQGLGITFIYNLKNKTKKEQWRYRNGIKQYMLEHTDGTNMLPSEPLEFEAISGKKELLWAAFWDSSTYSSTAKLAESYVNLIPTIQGGTHVNNFRTGLYEGIKEFCEQRKLLPKEIRVSSDDIWLNCNYILSVKIDNPHFSGQTKEKLSSQEQTVFITSKVKDAFILWLNSNSQIADSLAKMVIYNANERIKKAKQAKKNKNIFGNSLPGKLSNCLGNRPEDCELFLVEGDSAGGSAKQARDKKNQAVMPLRGKILNTWELSENRIMESQEVLDIIRAIGVLPNNDDLSGLRYDKICILADADSDGLHIASLLCALFVRHFPALVRTQKIHIAMPPLYRIDHGKQVYYALDEKEKDTIINNINTQQSDKARINIQRFKGLGEMNPAQLKETTMEPATRKLIVLNMEDKKHLCKKLDMLFNKKQSEDRRKWLEIKGELAQIA